MRWSPIKKYFLAAVLFVFPVCLFAADQAVQQTAKSTGKLSLPYEEIMGEKPIETIRKAGLNATGAAKSVGEALGQFIREKRRQTRQRELVQQFDQDMAYYLSRLDLSADEKRQLRDQVENAYIQDAVSGKHRLDQNSFRDLPRLIKKEYAERMKERTRSGSVDTYYPSGGLRTRWSFKDGKLDGAVTTYYEDGEILYIDVYKEGQRLSRKKYTADGRLEFEQKYSYDVEAPVAVPAVKPAPQTAEPVSVPPSSDEISPPAPAASQQSSASQAPDSDLVSLSSTSESSSTGMIVIPIRDGSASRQS